MALGYEFSNEAIKNDEIKYREFAYTNYLNVDKKYKDYFTQLAKSKDIVVDDTYRYIGQINEYFKDYSMFDLTNEEMVSYPEEEDKILYFMKEKSGLSENFAAATTLFYRSIGVPARYVQGYFSLPSAMGEPPIIVGGLFAHSWVEIYIDELGWMMVDTSIVNSLPDEYSEFLFGAPGVSINNFENRKLESIELSVTKDTYFVGSSFDKQDLTITAHYDNKTTAKIPVSLEYDTSNPNQSLVIVAQSFAYIGEKVVKVLYTEKGIPKTATLYINVVEPEIISFEPKEGTYQEKYILGATEPDINNIRFDGKLNDGSTTTFNKDGVIFEKDIDYLQKL